MVILFGVLSIVVGALGGLLIGWAGVGVAAVFGALAIFFQIRKNGNLEEGQRAKKAGIVCGIVGIVIAILGQIAIMGYADKLKEQADKMGEEAKYVSIGADGFKTFGIMGFLSKAMDAKPSGTSDEDFAKQLTDELDKVTKNITNK